MKLCSLALLIWCSTLLLSGAITNAQQSTPYDVLIRNARVVDGTGSPWFRADIALRGQTIAAIGQLGDAKAARVIDAQGLVAAPGFIDIHTHSRRHILQVPAAENYVRQGVTTVFEGNDGSSPLPLGEFLDQLAAAKIGINFGSFIGQGSIRREVLGNVDRAARPAELAKMKELARQGMRAGAFGLSTGLYYIPGAYTPTAEVIELARVVAPLGGIHISHMRDEAAGVVKSVAEIIEIGEQAGIPTQVTHHKIVGTPNWGRSVETLRLIAQARARGVDVSLDQYPYTASSTDLSALLPRWALEGNRADLQQRLSDPPTRARIKTETIENIKSSRGGGDPKNVALAQCTWERALEGKTLAEISIARGRTGSIEDGAETALEIVGRGDAQAVFHAINEEDLVRILRDPSTMVGSDGEILPLGLGVPHPRSYGTFARVLGRYVREQKALSLEDAIRKMTALPAQRVGLQERGLLRAGMKADVILFAPDRVRDRATFAAPHQYAEGFEYVWVNGGLLLDDGKMTNVRTGQVLRGPAMQQPGK